MLKNNLALAKEWLIKAQNDLKTAEILFQENGPTDTLCFHCQQAAEKVLKGFLVFNKKPCPKIHDLIVLLNLGKKIDKDLEELKEEVSFLNRFYFETRYPPEVAVYSKEECKAAIEKTNKLSQFIMAKIAK